MMETSTEYIFSLRCQTSKTNTYCIRCYLLDNLSLFIAALESFLIMLSAFLCLIAISLNSVEGSDYWTALLHASHLHHSLNILQ